MSDLRIMNWNTSGLAERNDRVDALYEKVEDSYFIAILEEVYPSAIDGLESVFGDGCTIIHPFDQIPLGASDRGVVALVGKNVTIRDCSYLTDTPFPENTLYLDVEVQDMGVKVLGLHIASDLDDDTVTEQFVSLTGVVNGMVPDIVCFDVSEPMVDHHDIDRMVFSEKGGEDARTFFRSMVSNGLKDTALIHRSISKLAEGEPIVVTCNASSKGHRHDHMFYREERFLLEFVSHHYVPEDATDEGHAMIELSGLSNPSGKRIGYTKPGEGDSPYTQDQLDDIWESSKYKFPRFTFADAEIPVGATLEFTHGKGVGSGITCTVKDDTHVEFEEGVYSLTSLASKLMGRPVKTGPRHFIYEGENVDARRRRLFYGG